MNGAQPTTRVLIDRKVYDVSKDLQGATGTAADLLNRIPSVDVDIDGNVSLRGDPNVTILVDGKPSAEFNGAGRGASLERLAGHDIDRIEVMPTPPAQYRAEGSGGIINIVTKKRRAAGLSGNLQANLGPDDRIMIAGDVSGVLGRWKFSGGADLRQDTRERRVSENQSSVDPLTGGRVRSSEFLEEHLRRLVPGVKASADYDIDDAHALGLSFQGDGGTRRSASDQANDSDAAPDGGLTSVDRLDDGHGWTISTTTEAHYLQRLNASGETLNLSLQRSTSRGGEDGSYTNVMVTPVGPRAFDQLRVSQNLVTTEFSTDYHSPLPKGGDLKLGYDFENDDQNAMETDVDFAPTTDSEIANPAFTSQFRANQSVNAAYVQLLTPWAGWTLQSGLRIEATDVRIKVPTGFSSSGQSYFGVYPSVHLDRRLSDHEMLNFSVARRIARPELDSLDPSTDPRDIHNLRAGDPDLRPQDTWSYQVAYENAGKRLTWDLTGYVRDSRDGVTTVSKAVAADVVLTTLANLPHSRAAGLEATVDGKLGARISYSFSANAAYTDIDTLGLGADGGWRSRTGVSGKASMDWRPTATDTAQVSFSRTDRRLIPQGYIGAFESVNLGYRRKLSGKLSLTFTVTDAFDTRRSERVIATPTLTDDYRTRQLGRITYLGLIYSFGGKANKTEQFDYDP